MKIQEQIKQRRLKLAAALRDYGKHCGTLADGTGHYCVMGAACNEYRLSRHRGRWDGQTFVLGKIRSATSAPGAVRRYYGLSLDATSKLMEHNDEGTPADKWGDIPKHLKGLPITIA